MNIKRSQWMFLPFPRFAESGRIYWVLSDHTGGFQKVEEDTDGTFAFIHEASQIKYEYYNNCNLTEIGDPFAEQPYAVAVQQGSHLQVLNSFTSSGVLLLSYRDLCFRRKSAKLSWNCRRIGISRPWAVNTGTTLSGHFVPSQMTRKESHSGQWCEFKL